MPSTWTPRAAVLCACDAEQVIVGGILWRILQVRSQADEREVAPYCTFRCLGSMPAIAAELAGWLGGGARWPLWCPPLTPALHAACADLGITNHLRIHFESRRLRALPGKPSGLTLHAIAKELWAVREGDDEVERSVRWLQPVLRAMPQRVRRLQRWMAVQGERPRRKRQTRDHHDLVALAMVAGFENTTIAAMLHAWRVERSSNAEADGVWASFATCFGFDPADEWHPEVPRALQAWLADDDEMPWHYRVLGSSRTTSVLREQVLSAIAARRSGRSVLLVAHDRYQADKLRTAIATEPSTDALASVGVVDPRDEEDAYRNAARSGTVVVDVPPLHERSYDVPVIARALLEPIRVAGERADPMPAAHELAWMQTAGWRDSGHLRDWLRNAWTDGADLSLPPAGMLPMPGIRNAAMWPTSIPYDEGAIRAQQIRWRLGGFVTQDEAVQGMWNVKNLRGWLWAQVEGRKSAVVKPLRLPALALQW